MVRSSLPAPLPLVAMVGLAGCVMTTVEPNCPDGGQPGIVLTLEDATTGARQFTDVVAIASEGAYADTAAAAFLSGDPPESLLSLADERPGTYTVTVRAAGYALWTMSNVRVEEEPVCNHVLTRSLTAKLQRLAGP